MHAPSPDTWSCPTCGAMATTPFCSQCGERRLEASDLTLRGLVKRVAHALTNVDKRVMRTAWTLLRSPGALTVAYVTGCRKPYIGPLQIFLLANVVFFAVQSFSPINVFGASLQSHMHLQDWRAWATHLVDQRLAGTSMTLAQYAPKFDDVAEANAKSLIIVMTVPFAFLAWLLFQRGDRPFLMHVAFALHAWAFLLVVFSAVLLLGDADRWAGGAGLASARVDHVLTALHLAACAVFVYIATGRVYGASGLGRIVRTAVLTFSVMALVLGYRLLLFVVTLYSTT